MGTLTVKESSLDGVDITTFEAAGVGGDEFLNTGDTFLLVLNGSGASINVTFDSQVACNQGSDHNKTVAVAAGKLICFGPFPTSRWNDGGGKVQVTYSAVTTVTVLAAKLS